MKRYIDMLKEVGVKPTYNIMEKLGFGRGTYNAYRSRTQHATLEEAPSNTIIKDRALASDSGKSTAVLPVGTTVIAKQGATDNAKKQSLKRDRAMFGKDNVVEECTGGTIVKSQKIKTSKGTTVIRDVCLDDR
jgi:hypothetical protein